MQAAILGNVSLLEVHGCFDAVREIAITEGLSSLRARAARTLVELGGVDVEATLLALLRELDTPTARKNSAEVIRAAIAGLGKVGTRTSVEPLQRLAKGEGYQDEAGEAITAIQERLVGAERGQLSLAADGEAGGALSLAGDQETGGALSITDGPGATSLIDPANENED